MQPLDSSRFSIKPVLYSNVEEYDCGFEDNIELEAIPVIPDSIFDPFDHNYSNILENDLDRLNPLPNLLRTAENIDLKLNNELLSEAENESISDIELNKSNNIYYYTPVPLTMRQTVDAIAYLPLENVFQYVTMGGSISELELKNLEQFILDKFIELTKRTKLRVPRGNIISGDIHLATVIQYNWQDYGKLALGCLEWAHSNSKNIGF